MAMKLIYSVDLQQTDNAGVPNGDTFTFTGSQVLPKYPPSNSDMTAAAVAMGVDIGAQMTSTTGYAAQNQIDQNNGG